MNSLHLMIALGPLALYLLMLGVTNLGCRPVVRSGAWDIAALAAGLSGFMIVGPLQLFVPEPAVQRLGGAVWLMLLCFYGLCITLWILLASPRVVIYNQTIETLRPVLAEVVGQLDTQARWAGDSLLLPQLGVQLHFDQFLPMRNVSLVAIGEPQSISGWQRLERSLATALRESTVTRNPRGFSMISAALLMIAYPIWTMTVRQDHWPDQLRNILGL